MINQNTRRGCTQTENIYESGVRLMQGVSKPESILVNRGVEGPEQKLFRALTLLMSGQGLTYRRLCGFTLIELLVVVVIIGILAAIAVPQYQKAVKKAQGTEVMLATEVLNREFAKYVLNNGQMGVVKARELEVDPPLLQHFGYETESSPSPSPAFQGGCPWNAGYGIVSGPVVYFVAEKAKLGVYWNPLGKIVKKECIGEDCHLYFDCVTNTYFPEQVSSPKKDAYWQCVL